MTRHWTWLAGMIAFGCSHSDSPIAPLQQVEDKQPARIEVTVEVDHPELALPAYGIALDGKHLIVIATNTTVPLIVEGGHHTISIEHTIGFWNSASDACRNTGLDAVSGIYPAGQTSSVGFSIHCGAVATASFTLTVNATGTNIPSAVPVAINRDAFPLFQLLVDAKIGEPKTYSVPLGVYFVEIGSSTCHLSSGQTRAVAFVMDTRPTGVTLAVICS